MYITLSTIETWAFRLICLFRFIVDNRGSQQTAVLKYFFVVIIYIIKGAHKETQVPFKHMLNWRFSSGCSKKLGSLFDITQIVFEQSHL